MRFKHLLAIPALAIALTFLVSCEPIGAQTDVSVSAAPGETSALSFRITWTDYSGRGQAIAKIVDGYNKSQTGGASVQLIGGDEDEDAIRAMLEQNPETVFVLPYRYVQYFSGLGYLADLSGAFSGERNRIKQMAADCFRRMRALVLDQNEVSGIQLAEYLRSFGIATDLTSSEQDAPKLIRKAADEEQKPYNLIVVDFSTPLDGGIAFTKKLRHSPYSDPSCKYIAILPMSQDEMYEELEAAGIDFGIMKPIIPSILYNGIVEIFDISPPELQRPVPNAERQVRQGRFSVLLVEDNKTNQFIAKTILEQAGIVVSLASNGEEGCRYYKDHQEEIDLILMDLHMPVMDGYTASDCVRAFDTKIPIVAMTADAIAGVEEQCRAHGIYEYVSKPFEPEQLIETIYRILKDKEPETPAQEPRPSGESAGGLNTADGLKRIGGDEAIYRLVLREFADENKTVGGQLRRAVDAGDTDAAVQIVHKIKSSSGSIGAAELHETATELQKALQGRDQPSTERLHGRFQTLLIELLRAIEAYLNETA